jgi:hypothetical protein
VGAKRHPLGRLWWLCCEPLAATVGAGNKQGQGSSFVFVAGTKYYSDKQMPDQKTHVAMLAGARQWCCTLGWLAAAAVSAWV